MEGSPVKVPGARAPEIAVPSFVNSWPRLLLKCGGDLASFVQSMLSDVPFLRDEGTPLRLPWPMPIPYPEAFKRGGGDGSMWRKRRTCVQVMVLNWLWLGRPSIAPRSLKLGQKLTSGQWRIVRLFEALSEDANSVLVVDAAGMGRSAAKTETQDEELGALHRAVGAMQNVAFSYGQRSHGRSGREEKESNPGNYKNDDEDRWQKLVIGQSDTASFTTAKPLIADRIKFGPKPGFDPVPFLDPKTAAMYVHPELHHRDEPDEPPSVSVRAEPQEKVKLFRNMAACGRLKLLPEGAAEERFASGMFAVVKDMEKDRLIMDSRPANGREIGLNHWCSCLANASLLGGIELRPDEDLLLSGQDIKDFFYQFTVGPDRLRRNCLIGKLDFEELSQIFPGHEALPEEGGYVALSTMAMGDLCAVEFAQCSHISIMLQSGALHPTELLRLRSPVPRGPFVLGLVIDDLVMLERVLKDAGASETVADVRMKLATEMYDRVNLPTNPSKAFQNARHARFWGAEVDGELGVVRPNSMRLWPLMLITLRVCCLGVCSISLLESLAGSWISILMFRRRCMSVMNEVFDVLHCGATSRDVVRLSGTLINELFAIAILGTMCFINLRAASLSTFRATDASDWGMAAVSADLEKPVVREAMRFSLSRSLWTKLLPPGKAWLREKGKLAGDGELPDGEEPYDVHPLWEVLARALQFKEEWRREHRRSIHINVAELKANLIEEENLCKIHQSFRCLYGLDSQVALGCLVKGRSSSKVLNRVLEKSVPTMLGADAYGHYGFLPSALNRADDPTRDREVGKPDMKLPSWWHSLAVDENVEAFDAWLQDLSSKLTTAAETHDFSDLGYKSPLCLDSRRTERKKEKLEARSVPSKICSDPQPAAVTKLCSDGGNKPCVFEERAVKILEELDGRGQVWWPKDSTREFVAPGALDLFTGQGGVAKRLLRNGCPFVVTYEWNRSAGENLLWKENQEKIMELVKMGAFKVVGSALICKSFTRAITPAVRSKRFPRGIPWMRLTMRASVAEGNKHADFGFRLIQLCEAYGVKFWLENPDSSFLWSMPRFRRRFRAADSLELLRVDYCRFGTPWRKRTRVATNVESLQGVRMLCRCSEKGRSHIPLRGNHPTLKKPWTSVAEPYPLGFCSLVAGGIASSIGWSCKLDIASCSRSQTLRIGEAKNPGPGRQRLPRNLSLENMPQQLFASVALGERCWIAFYEWAQKDLRQNDPLQLFLLVPLFLAHAIRRYGDLLFSSGGALLYYRHLVLAAQQRVPNVKQFVHICWELAGRWELAEPVKHRVPIPLKILQALAALSFSLGWRRWCGTSLLCFFGIARVGEVLNCRRKHLLLPADLLEEDETNRAAFLVLESSKTSRRQAARVQHLKIVDAYVVKLLEEIFGFLSREDFLFGGSPSAYRTRWNYLLETLGIPTAVKLTPGGLRGGGAVESYRRGTSIAEIQWRMRLKNQSTLESYLQEVAALSALTELPSAALRAVRACSKVFPHLS